MPPFAMGTTPRERFGAAPPLDAKGADAVTPVTVPAGHVVRHVPLRQKVDAEKILAALFRIRAEPYVPASLPLGNVPLARLPAFKLVKADPLPAKLAAPMLPVTLKSWFNENVVPVSERPLRQRPRRARSEAHYRERPCRRRVRA